MWSKNDDLRNLNYKQIRKYYKLPLWSFKLSSDLKLVMKDSFSTIFVLINLLEFILLIKWLSSTPTGKKLQIKLKILKLILPKHWKLLRRVWMSRKKKQENSDCK
jgi:hypothetical protein